ncbi:MAG: hypothetical protein ACJ8ED_19625 [Xanthobacteraceae bacterium]
MTRRINGGEEQYRRDFREIFAETGHRTLNALLIVSGGAAVSFLTFLGSAVKEVGAVQQVGSTATRGFILAMQLFIAAVVSCIVAHGTTYFSHGAYHFRHDRTGHVLMGVTIFLGFACVGMFVYGSYAAIDAFAHAAETLARHAQK